MLVERLKRKDEGTRKVMLTAILCVIWYVVSLGKTLLVKYISTLFKKPLTLSFVQLVSISIYSIPLLYFCKLRFFSLSRRYFLGFLVPLSILKAATTASSHLAIWNISVSYSQIMRASIPVFTAFFCWVLLRTRLSIRCYLALIPIVLGVGVTTVTESDFSIFGMLWGLAATSLASLQSIYNKVLLDRTEIHSFQLTALLGWVSTSLFFFVWFSVDGLELVKMEHNFDIAAPEAWKVPALLILDGFINFIQNVVAFAVLFLVTPTSYAVGNITKRPLIIAVSIYVFQNTVTAMNILGIVITCLGASLYTYFTLDEKNRKPAVIANEDLGSSRELASVMEGPINTAPPIENSKNV